MVEAPNFEVYAVRYAHREARRDEHFYGHDPHDGPMPMDYFVWAAVSSDHTVVVDTGFAPRWLPAGEGSTSAGPLMVWRRSASTARGCPM